LISAPVISPAVEAILEEVEASGLSVHLMGGDPAIGPFPPTPPFLSFSLGDRPAAPDAVLAASKLAEMFSRHRHVREELTAYLDYFHGSFEPVSNIQLGHD
jgi:hypothetical protein